jgi:hypothetical protein
MAKAGLRHGRRHSRDRAHVIEPDDLWQRDIEPGYRDWAPRFAPIDGSDYALPDAEATRCHA